MSRRAARLLFRVAGWLLTPLVLVCAAGIGATIGLLIAPRLSPNAGLALTVACALIGAIAGLILWMRLLRDSPELRHTFAMTEAGLPESELVEHLVHPDAAKPDPP
jgi:ABC-type enterochelin transport system permease subunit